MSENSKTLKNSTLNQTKLNPKDLDGAIIALIAKKNNGKENKILPPTASMTAIKSDKIMIKLRTPFAIFLLFALTNQDSNKNVMTKMIIPVNIIFI